MNSKITFILERTEQKPTSVAREGNNQVPSLAMPLHAAHQVQARVTSGQSFCLPPVILCGVCSSGRGIFRSRTTGDGDCQQAAASAGCVPLPSKHPFLWPAAGPPATATAATTSDRDELPLFVEQDELAQGARRQHDQCFHELI